MAHVTHGFFPIQGNAGHSRRQAAVDGEAYVTPGTTSSPATAGTTRSSSA
jgi:hypothetical protein